MAKLTKRTVDAAKPDAKREQFWWDDELRGFGLRVKPSGVKSYLIQYRIASGVSRRMTLGQHGVFTPEEARRQARIQLGRVAKGEDPAAEKSKARGAISFAEFADRYFAEHAETKKKLRVSAWIALTCADTSCLPSGENGWIPFRGQTCCAFIIQCERHQELQIVAWL